jgi:SAM-dependent methyltransferase
MNRRACLGAFLALPAVGCAARFPPPPAPESPEGVFFTAGVPYVPTRPEVMEVMLSLAEIGPKDVVYDLGCGDGRLVIAACKRFGARGLGADLDSNLVARAQAEAQWQGVADRARFVTEDLFELDLAPASVVMLYLSVEINIKLRPKFLQQLSPGARIVSNRFDMADVWPPLRTVQAGDTPVHLWRVPSRGG